MTSLFVTFFSLLKPHNAFDTGNVAVWFAADIVLQSYFRVKVVHISGRKRATVVFRVFHRDAVFQLPAAIDPADAFADVHFIRMRRTIGVEKCLPR